MKPRSDRQRDRRAIDPANPLTEAPSMQAVFLDRDGTLIENRHYLGRPDGVVLLPGVSEVLGRLKARGVKLFLFTNQSGVGRGLFTLADVDAVHQRMIDMLGLGGDIFTDVCVATERPDEPPVYRKPSPRFIREMIDRHGFAAESAWMLGDAPSDWEAGVNAGIRAAAIVADPVPAAASARCEALGITIYRDLLHWCAEQDR